MDLEAVESLTGDPGSARERLVELVPVTFRCDWAVGLRRTPEGVVVTTATATAPDVPADVEHWVGLQAARHLPSVLGWDNTVLAAVPVGGPDESVVFGRRGGPEILSSELARLAHLAALAASISDAVR
jgi:hypothetical protein